MSLAESTAERVSPAACVDGGTVPAFAINKNGDVTAGGRHACPCRLVRLPLVFRSY